MQPHPEKELLEWPKDNSKNKNKNGIFYNLAHTTIANIKHSSISRQSNLIPHTKDIHIIQYIVSGFNKKLHSIPQAKKKSEEAKHSS